MKSHCDNKHAGNVQKLMPGEQPLNPYCSNWLEVAQSLGKVKPIKQSGSTWDVSEIGEISVAEEPRAESREISQPPE